MEEVGNNQPSLELKLYPKDPKRFRWNWVGNNHPCQMHYKQMEIWQVRNIDNR